MDDQNLLRILEKPYICDFLGCQIRFTNKAHKKRHYDEQHRNVKAFLCKWCRKNFKRKEQLKIHLRGVRNFCGKQERESKRNQEIPVHETQHTELSNQPGPSNLTAQSPTVSLPTPGTLLQILDFSEKTTNSYIFKDQPLFIVIPAI